MLPVVFEVLNKNENLDIVEVECPINKNPVVNEQRKDTLVLKI